MKKECMCICGNIITEDNILNHCNCVAKYNHIDEYDPANMYQSVVISENRDYKNASDNDFNKCPVKNVVIHNSSKEHITIVASDSIIGNSVSLMIRKKDIPYWVLEKKEQ